MQEEIKKIKDILVSGNYISSEDAKKAEDFAKKNNTSFTDYLFQEGLITSDLLGQAMAEFFKIPYSNTEAIDTESDMLNLIPEAIAKKYRVIPIKNEKNEVMVATDMPYNTEMESGLRKIFPKKKIKLSYCLSEVLDQALSRYQKPLETRFSKIIEKGQHVATELLDEIFDDALLYHASDIHFEPQSKETIIRFRVDGVLHEAGKISGDYYENVLNRIKVKSNLRIDEHFSAQDGALRYEKNEKTVDMRTSIVPTIDGEKIVLRLLASYVQGFGLGELGLSERHQEILLASAKKPFGMILIAGPTGSGKSTSLYALIKLLNDPGKNITTIEDPVEYKIKGVNQIQVNTETNLTFAKGLRSIVRQDPNIILVGEIRDQETAEISVNAALTGHLLFTTFHANDAATAIPRLLDMGIEPFLLASTMDLMIAQRLVRKICPQCRYSVSKKLSDFSTPQLEAARTYFDLKDMTLYQGKGCSGCDYTGYKGRTAIFEFIQVTPAMQNLIIQSPSAQEIWKLARKEGAFSLFEDGVEKVKNGVTTIEELLRVSEPPQKITK